MLSNAISTANMLLRTIMPISKTFSHTHFFCAAPRQHDQSTHTLMVKLRLHGRPSRACPSNHIFSCSIHQQSNTDRGEFHCSSITCNHRMCIKHTDALVRFTNNQTLIEENHIAPRSHTIKSTRNTWQANLKPSLGNTSTECNGPRHTINVHIASVSG